MMDIRTQVEQSVLRLAASTITVVREMSAARGATNQELAQTGLAIGNNLDNRHKNVFDWAFRTDGIMSRQYRMSPGKWPVWLVKDQQEFEKRFGTKSLDGVVVYRAEIDLKRLKIGTNVPFEYLRPGETLKLPDTTLSISEDSEGLFALVSDIPTHKLQPPLAARFDDEGRLRVNERYGIGGEFYIAGYEGPQDLINEHIFRVEEGRLKEITNEVISLRESDGLVLPSLHR